MSRISRWTRNRWLMRELQALYARCNSPTSLPNASDRSEHYSDGPDLASPLTSNSFSHEYDLSYISDSHSSQRSVLESDGQLLQLSSEESEFEQ